ncbi:hypothetical protein CPB86DRAFT_731040 [Serendipita vermifera]|nr:hypothetical protein CPB86DRAFT_731040 [Serendipita vermifera]
MFESSKVLLDKEHEPIRIVDEMSTIHTCEKITGIVVDNTETKEEAGKRGGRHPRAIVQEHQSGQIFPKDRREVIHANPEQNL